MAPAAWRDILRRRIERRKSGREKDRTAGNQTEKKKRRWTRKKPGWTRIAPSRVKAPSTWTDIHSFEKSRPGRRYWPPDRPLFQNEFPLSAGFSNVCCSGLSASIPEVSAAICVSSVPAVPSFRRSAPMSSQSEARRRPRGAQATRGDPLFRRWEKQIPRW